MQIFRPTYVYYVKTNYLTSISHAGYTNIGIKDLHRHRKQITMEDYSNQTLNGCNDLEPVQPGPNHAVPVNSDVALT